MLQCTNPITLGEAEFCQAGFIAQLKFLLFCTAVFVSQFLPCKAEGRLSNKIIGLQECPETQSQPGARHAHWNQEIKAFGEMYSATAGAFVIYSAEVYL